MTPGLLTTSSRLEIAKNFEPSATSPPGQMLQVCKMRMMIMMMIMVTTIRIMKIIQFMEMMMSRKNMEKNFELPLASRRFA